MTLREFRDQLWDIAAKAPRVFEIEAGVKVKGQMGTPDTVEWYAYLSGYPIVAGDNPEELIAQMRRNVLGLDEVGGP